jgi:hypothetical protein
MFSIDRIKVIGIFMNAEMVSKLYEASATVTAHRAFAAVGIIVFHFEIVPLFIIQQHEAVCTYAESPVAQKIDLFRVEVGVLSLPVIEYYKIISRSLVFVELHLHVSTKLVQKIDGSLDFKVALSRQSRTATLYRRLAGVAWSARGMDGITNLTTHPPVPGHPKSNSLQRPHDRW